MELQQWIPSPVHSHAASRASGRGAVRPVGEGPAALFLSCGVWDEMRQGDGESLRGMVRREGRRDRQEAC